MNLDKYERIPELRQKIGDKIHHYSGPSFWSTKIYSEIDGEEQYNYRVEFEILKNDEIEYVISNKDDLIKISYYLKSRKNKLD